MCGIAGIASNEKSWVHNYLRPVTDALHHRGPDDSGTWLHENLPLGFGHRRLSIVDLSPNGHQPMRSRSARYTISFNGEVFNFKDLRATLEALGHSFRGTSDTEIMLAAFEQWGVEQAVPRFVGMFAFALWDEKEQLLTLVRDRLGIKPLYFGVNRKGLLFASELKSFVAHREFPLEINRDAVALLLRYCYIPAPYSIYHNVEKLEAGSLLQFKFQDGSWNRQPARRYWDLKQVAHKGVTNRFAFNDREAEEALDSLLREVIALRMIADVPLGAFLSGGIDSSTVVAIMQQLSSRPAKTFSIGFSEAHYNEADHARAVADHLKTEHTELVVTPAEARAVIPMLPSMYDEPFADSSQIPTYLVSKLARSAVTVSLSGDGGDELFAGYRRYPLTNKLWSVLRCMPCALRQPLSHFIATGVSMLSGGALDAAESKLFKARGGQRIGAKLSKLAEIFGATSDLELYHRAVSHWRDPHSIVLGAKPVAVTLDDPTGIAELPTLYEKMMLLDQCTYLPDDILTKVDRASMAVSLEARVPLLDHRLVEFAWRVPLSLKCRAGKGKWLLRKVLSRYMPESLFERPKMGFGIPVGEWLRHELREWAEDLLAPARLARTGFFNVEEVRRVWAEHLSGKANRQYLLWDVLMFEAWLDSR